MRNWEKRGNCNSVEEYLLATTGETKTALHDPAAGDPRKVAGMREAAKMVTEAIDAGTPITIVGDYDSDGMNATAILVRLFRYFGVEPKTIIPRRFSDGYGLSQGLVDMIPKGLVITIDNGITAVYEIAQLREKGCSVIVMDHHLPGPELPPADVLVDPKVCPEKNEFDGYCGAGLGYLLAMLLLEGDHTRKAEALRRNITVHAAIATVTDVMPLLGPNRRLVMDGLSILNGDMRGISPGLAALRNSCKSEHFDESSLGFNLGPMLNATARLYDRGGTSVLKALACDDPIEAKVYADKMVQINEKRKRLTALHLGSVKRIIRAEKEGLAAPLIVVGDQIPEGLIGILAGNLLAEYGIATFVLTEQKENPDILKGSARANTKAGEDITPLLDAIRPLCISCGGHSGAAGISLYKKDLPKVKQVMREAMAGTSTSVANTLEYDLEITDQDIPRVYQEVSAFAPYGEGCPAPVFLIKGYQTEERFGSHYRCIGQAGDSVRINGRQSDVFGYQMAKQYSELGCPRRLDILGTIASNTYQGRTTIQIRPLDFRPAVVEGGTGYAA